MNIDRGTVSMREGAGVSSQMPGQAYFLDLLGDAYNGLGRYEEAIVALSEAAGVFRRCAHSVPAGPRYRPGGEAAERGGG